MTPKSLDPMPTSFWGVAAKWPTRAPKTKLILCQRDPARIQPYQFEHVRQDLERVLEHRVSFEANPMRYSIGFAKSHSPKCSLHKWAWCGAARKSARLNCINLIHFRPTAGRLRGNSCIVIPGVFFLNFIKSETSDSFVSHFDGHFAYLKTLDFYFKSLCLSLSLTLVHYLHSQSQYADYNFYTHIFTNTHTFIMHTCMHAHAHIQSNTHTHTYA